MEKVLLIGIGAGDPEYVTVQAVNALNTVDVFFVLEKAAEQEDLVALRREIVERYVHEPVRMVAAADPPRGRDVEAWRAERARLVSGLLAEETGVGAFLVWGDPSLYDGMIDILERLGVAYEVIPGISAVSALAARHRLVLNRVAGDVLVTTGRRVAAGLPDDARDVVVMLDSKLAFTALDGEWEIYWGAYLGTPDEILISGRLSEVADEIVRVRAEARTRKGWMFDTYLLRR
ncbi:precorrin-6A synthase (deacetylating) [Solirubrobacter ginsenosidimutans]|uniref:Precorrin-6A synthase (Deacetylating) n=1 Tax=Solirubrobacter ginsenosidimutans TaxID=490573 RepID=A0A9X3MTR0_9ACTN|nr:precorrin-6A synthase (deacetylating) [Solirubrobacter ginsenosidimutans]MDA0162514.1 precorrin-6A synthase (deacetylating) [Solirubrobacter ginsenosidimutans]